MKILLLLIVICLTSISLGLISDKTGIDNRLEVSDLIKSNLRIFEVEIYLKTHFSNIDYAVSPKKSSLGMVASINIFTTISRGIGQPVQTPQELITLSNLQIKQTIITI